MAVSSRRIVGSRVIDLDFDVRQDSTVTLDAVAEVFQALTKSLHTIQVIGLSPVAPMIPPLMEPRILHLQYASPLKVKFQVLSISKEAATAFLAFCQNIIFYRQDRSRRAAEAASAWEDVYAKRLQNVKTAIQLAASANHQAQVTAAEVDELMTAARVLQQSDLKLTNIKMDHDD